MKTKTIPFDLEMAKKIQAGEIKGKIKTRNLKHECAIVDYSVHTGYTGIEELLLVEFPAHDFEMEKLKVYHSDGRYMDKKYGDNWFDLVLEVPDNEQQFKPFDRVLVRDRDDEEWLPTFFGLYGEEDGYRYVTVDNCLWKQCLPYDGNENLVGTTDKPIF